MPNNLVPDSAAVNPSRQAATRDRRQSILDVACAMFFARGFAPVSIAEIGTAAGITGPAVYRHFASKAEILDTLCHQTIDRLIEFVGPRRAAPTEELAALVAGQVKLIVQYPALVRVFADEERALPAERRRLVRRRERDHAQRWVDALAQLHPDTAARDLELLAYAAVGLILSAPRWPARLRADPNLPAQLVSAAHRVLAGGAGAVRNVPPRYVSEL